MKKTLPPFFFLLIMLFAACNNNNSVNSKLQGKWKSKDGATQLTITKKEFTMQNDEPVTEDYFTKGDTIFTSYQGIRPYTEFIIKKLDDHNLNLLYPDSVLVEFVR